ncbi:MAG: HAMP domain-containing protein, partial [Myxococcota bacterium]
MVRPKFGLTAKLTFVLAIGVLLVEGVLTMGWLARERTVLDQKVQQDERALGAALAIALSEIASRDGVDRAKAVVQQIDREAKVPLSLSWEEGAPAVDASRDASGWTQSTWNRQSVALSRVPIPETGAALVVGDPLADEVAYLSQSRNNALYALAATVLVCVLIAAIAGYFLVSRPVSALVHHARSVAAGRLDTRSRIRGGGELAALSKELNAMTAALAAA